MTSPNRHWFFSQKEKEEEISGGVCEKSKRHSHLLSQLFSLKKLFPTGSLSLCLILGVWESPELSFSLMRRSLVYILPCLMWWDPRFSAARPQNFLNTVLRGGGEKPHPGSVCAHETLLGTLPELLVFFLQTRATFYILRAQFGKTNARRRVWLAGRETSESCRSQR
jgi:hypothetical protein